MAAKQVMAEKILYCQKCGRLIPPDEAEAEDFQALGGPPACAHCLHADPERRQALESVRTARLKLTPEQFEQFKQAHAPNQIYPAPDHPLQDDPTQTNIRELREQLIAELRKEREQERGQGAVSPPPQNPPEPAGAGAVSASAGGRSLGEAEVAVPLEPAAAAAMLARSRDRLGLRLRQGIAGLLLLALLLAGLLWLTWSSEGSRPRPAGSGQAGPVEAVVPAPTADALERQRRRFRERLQEPAAPPAAPNLLAQVETIIALTGEEPSLAEALAAMERLRLPARVGNEAAGALAREHLARYQRLVDARVRQQAREEAQEAVLLAEGGAYAQADQMLEAALQALPKGSAWAQERGGAQLTGLREELQQRKARGLSEARGALERLVAAGNTLEARRLVERWRQQGEPEYAVLAKGAEEEIAKRERQEAERLRQERESALRAWPVFFEAFDEALAAGRPEQAAALSRPPAGSPLWLGGVENPALVLEGFAGEAQGVEALFGAGEQIARAQTGKPLALPQRFPGQTPRLKGVQEGKLELELAGGAAAKLAVQKLAPDEWGALLGLAGREEQARHQPALWALRVAGGEWRSASAGEALTRLYQGLNRSLPFHWAQRFGAQRRRELNAQAAPLLVQLREALDAKQGETVRTTLLLLRGLLGAEAAGVLSAEEKQWVAQAEQRVGKTSLKQLILQNGLSPAPDFAGLRVDQINSYAKNQQRTDVDVQTGLKLGSHGGLQRLLFRFEGLPAVLGAAKVKKAVFELFQLEAEKAEGVKVGLFRLKRIWKPDAGSWLNADERRKKPWEQPGANGPGDAAQVPEALLKLDDQKDLWRSWDVTSYVQEIQEDRTPNHGLLMRITESEPRYGLRFYPDCDLEQKPDAQLRPRLIIEYEVSEVK